MTSKAEGYKAEGNAAFKAKDFAGAIAAFSKAVAAEPEKVEYYSNRSAAYAKNSQLAEALADAEKCISLDATWGKGYSRKGSALILMKEYTKAVACYAAGIAADPENELLTDGLVTAQKAMTSGKKKKKRGKKAKAQAEVEEVKEGEDEKTDYVIGIDLGTTYSCVGVWINDSVTIIENKDGEKTIPSYVSFNPETGERVTGNAAKNQITRFPTNTLYDVKRFIGQRFTDQGVEADIEKLQYEVIKGSDSKPQVIVTSRVRRHPSQVKRFPPWCSHTAKSSPRTSWAKQSPVQLSLCPLTSTTLSVTPPSLLAALLDSMCFVSSTNLPLLPSVMVSITPSRRASL